MTTKTKGPTTERGVITEKITVLKHLTADRSPEIVSAMMRCATSRVLDIASVHGYPHKDKMTWAIKVLEGKLAELEKAEAITPREDLKPQVAAASHRPTRVPIPGPRVTTRGASTTGHVGGTAPTPTPEPSENDRLLTLAADLAESSARIRNALAQANTALAKLRGTIETFQEKEEARRRAFQEKEKAKRVREVERAKARAEVERLAAELAEARKAARDAGRTTRTKKTTRTLPKGEHPCPHDGCGRVFDTGQGVSLHARLKCEHRPDADQ